MTDDKGTRRDTLISGSSNRRMFDAIAGRYDLMNRLISLGLDGRWRRKAVSYLDIPQGGRVLDIGTGTGDVAIEVLRRFVRATVVGIDPAAGMLKLAEAKLDRCELAGRVYLQAADAMALPFADASFSGVITAFCLRNIEDRRRALEEMRRVLQPGGSVVLLELLTPHRAPARCLHKIYARTVIPMVSSLLSRRWAYRYLVESVDAFPSAGEVVEMMDAAGFEQTRCVQLMLGAVGVFCGIAPADGG